MSAGDERSTITGKCRYSDRGQLVPHRRSVSKTHRAVGVDARGMWITDRHSTSETVKVTANGETSLVAGVRTPLLPGDVVHLGQRSFDVIESDGDLQGWA